MEENGRDRVLTRNVCTYKTAFSSLLQNPKIHTIPDLVNSPIVNPDLGGRLRVLLSFEFTLIPFKNTTLNMRTIYT